VRSLQTVDDYVLINKNRANIFSFLSKIYEKELTNTQILEIGAKENSFPTLDAIDIPGCSEIKEGFKLMRKYFDAINSSHVDKVELDLAEDYAGIFLGVRGKVPHPSESAYRSRDGTIMQKQRDEVLELYRLMNLDKSPSFKEPEDHIAIELSFMAYLANKTASALESSYLDDAQHYLCMQKKFLEEHLARWVPRFCEDVFESARTDFYRGVAMVTKGLLKMECFMINELVDSIIHLCNDEQQPTS
jgi:TorA maturation chaperone TorD